jgi:RTX calcium-binding nonapeptide repeat (4 copies)
MAIITGTGPNQTLIGTTGADTITAFAGSGNDLLQGLAGTDSMLGDGGNDTLDGGPGADTMVGGAGDDTYVVDVAGDIANETLGGSGYDGVNVGFTVAGTYTLLSGIEWARITTVSLALLVHLIGNALNNQLYGNGGNNSLSGLGGDDQLDGDAGNDTLLGGIGFDNLTGGLGNDSLDGGTDWDWANYPNASAEVSVNLSIGRSAGALGIDSLAGIEAVRGGPHADTLTGDANNNHFEGAAGGDSIDGGGGTDSVGYWSAPSGVVVNLADGTTSGGEGNDTLSSIEEVRGSM